MHNNGVSHAVTASDFDGVSVILRWLSYIPKVCCFIRYFIQQFLYFMYKLYVVQTQIAKHILNKLP